MLARIVAWGSLAITCGCGALGSDGLDADVGDQDGPGSGDDAGGLPATSDNAAVVLAPVPWERLLFGPTLVGWSTSASATLTARRAVSRLRVAVTRAGYTATSDCPDALAEGEMCHVNLVFAPLSQGSYHGDHNLSVSWTEPDGDGELHAGLGGIGIVAAHAPGLVLAQSEVRFPPTVLGESSTLRIPVVNTGSSPESVGVATPGDAPQFAFAVDPGCNWVLPGEGCTINVTFTPAEWGCRNGQFKVSWADPWTLVSGCAARREERGRARLDGVGRLVRDGAGFLFTNEPDTFYPGSDPTRGRIHRLLADGDFDPAFGDGGHLTLGTATYRGQLLREISPGHHLWAGDTGAGTDLALVADGVGGDLIHVDCRVVDAAISDTGAIGLLCSPGADNDVAVVQRQPDLSEDVGFGRAVVFRSASTQGLGPLSLAFDAVNQRWVVGAYSYRVHLAAHLATVGAAGETAPGFAVELPIDYGFGDVLQTLVAPDGSLFVVGEISLGGTKSLSIAKIADDGSLDPAFAGGSVTLPVDPQEYLTFVPVVPLAPTGDQRIAFLEQRLDFRGGAFRGARWVATACDLAGNCTEEERIAPSKDAVLPISLRDGDRWLASGWLGHTTFNWRYHTIGIAAVRADGSLDPGFASSDDVVDTRPAPVAPWRMRADASGHLYVAAHDLLGQHRQPNVTRFDAAGVRDPSFLFQLPPRAPESVLFWETLSGAGGESLNGRNLDLAIEPDGGGVLATFDGNARTVSLHRFVPGGAPDEGFGAGGHATFDFTLDADAMFGGPFGVILARLEDGSFWVSINSSAGILRHVSAQGQPLGDWVSPAKGAIGALLPAGADLLVFAGGGALRITAGGELVPIGGNAGPNTAVARAPDGGYFVATPCISRFTAAGVLADGIGGKPLFGDRGTLCFDANSYDAARALFVRNDGSLDLYTGSHRTELSPDGQVLSEDAFAPDLVRDVAETGNVRLLVGRDPAGRLIVTSE